jgi:hypothetical protein
MAQSQPSTKTKYSIFKKILLTIFILWLALYLCVWAFSPMAVRYFASQPLAELNLSLDDASSVRFNPFTSTLSLDAVSLLDANKKQVFALNEGEISLHVHRLLLSQVYVSEFLIDQVKVDIVKQGDSLFVAGYDINKPSEPAPQAPISQSEQSESSIDVVLPRLILKNIDVNAQIDGLSQTLSLQELSIANLLANQQKQVLDLSMQATINEAPLTLDSQINLNNNMGDINANIALSDFPLASVSPFLEAQAIEIAGMFSLSAAPSINISSEGIKINSQELSLGLSDLLLSAQSILVEGKNHSIVAKDLVANTGIDGALKNASTELVTELSKGKVAIATPQNNVANWESISALTSVSLTSDENGSLLPSIKVPNLTFNTLHLSEDLSLASPAPMLSFGQLIISDLTFLEQQLLIDKVQIADLNADLQVNGDKTIRSLVDTSALSTSPSEEAGEAEQVAQSDIPTPNIDLPPDITTENAPPPMVIALNTFELLNTGVVKIKDESVKPPFEQQLTIQTLSAGPFDTREPNAQSPFKLVVIDDNYLKVDANGFISPFAKQLNAKLLAKVAELNLPSVSPYVKGGLGFEMKTGQLDVTVEMSIIDDEIDGKTNLFLRGIEMSGADDVEKGAIKEGKAMPLNLALGLLKDGDGNIDLDVPISGNVASPSFGIESFVTLIVKKAAMSQAKNYLMNTFVPYASVVSVALSGAEYLLKIKFEPLTFDPTQSALKEENTEFLSQLAQLMIDNEELQIKTCPLVTLADLSLATKQVLDTAQKAQLKLLGDERQSNLKRSLVEQGIASNRVLYCAPELDSKAKAVPRIELKTD